MRNVNVNVMMMISAGDVCERSPTSTKAEEGEDSACSSALLQRIGSRGVQRLFS